jgi:hypothetical protein
LGTHNERQVAVKKRCIRAAILGLAASASVQGATVTYTLSLHESITCQPTLNNAFTVWVTVSPNDNSGLFAYGVDLTGTGDTGGPTTMTMTNRTPAGTFDANPNDPNFDPNDVYPTKSFGFTVVRGAGGVTGIGSGSQDLGRGADMIALFGYGQVSGAASNLRPPPPYQSNPAQPAGDLIWPPCTPVGIAAGSARLVTGTWTGNLPAFQTTSVDNTASVWRLSHPNNTENDVVKPQFVTRIVDPGPLVDVVSLTGTAQNSNQAVGGSILVSGSNGSYLSEVDQLLNPSVNNGSAPIQTIGDEAGNIYVMAKLIGTAADISAVLTALSNDVDASDSQFALLHASYDASFGSGGFNALFKFPNIAGSKVFNWDFTEGHPGVTVDKLAVAPEPGSLVMLGVAGAALWRRRRR